MKNFNIAIIFLILMTSCGGLKDAAKVMRNEKVQNSDEFLVEKREPLVLPPNYKDLPEPGSLKTNDKNEDSKIKKILNSPQTEKTKKFSSTEKAILDKISK